MLFKAQLCRYRIRQRNKIWDNLIHEFRGNWKHISSDVYLSEDFIREHANDVHWFQISQYQQLSEEFIIEFSHKVNWNFIVKYQDLSTNFIKGMIRMIS